VFRVGEHELGDACALDEFDVVMHLEEAFAAALVAGVPDGGVQHARVPHERRPRVDEPDVLLGDRDGLAVPDDVRPLLEVVRAGVRVAVFDVDGTADGLGVAFLARPDLLVVETDAAGFALFEHRLQRQVDAVGLDLLGSCRFDVRCDERATAVHTRQNPVEPNVACESPPSIAGGWGFQTE